MGTGPVAPTAAQPGQAEEAPQGQGGSGSDLYQEVLSAIPEELRGQVEPHLKKWDSGVTERFQELADLRQQTEPLQQLGFLDMEPEALNELATLAELAANPEEFGEWLLDEAVERDLLPDNYEELLDLEGASNPEGEEDFSDGGEDNFKDEIREMFSEMLDERLGPIEEDRQKSEEEKRIQQASEEIDKTLSELAGDEELSDEDVNDILAHSLKHAKDGTVGPDAVKAGFKDFQETASRIESRLFEQKDGQPATPEQGGRPNTAQEKPKSFAEAREAAIAMARNSDT